MSYNIQRYGAHCVHQVPASPGHARDQAGHQTQLQGPIEDEPCCLGWARLQGGKLCAVLSKGRDIPRDHKGPWEREAALAWPGCVLLLGADVLSYQIQVWFCWTQFFLRNHSCLSLSGHPGSSKGGQTPVRWGDSFPWACPSVSVKLCQGWGHSKKGTCPATPQLPNLPTDTLTWFPAPHTQPAHYDLSVTTQTSYSRMGFAQVEE